MSLTKVTFLKDELRQAYLKTPFVPCAHAHIYWMDTHTDSLVDWMTLNFSWFDKLRENHSLARLTPPLTKYRQRCCCERNQHCVGKPQWSTAQLDHWGLPSCPVFPSYQSGHLQPQQACLSYRVLGLGPHCVHYFLSERLIGSMVRSKRWQTCSYGLNFVTSLKVKES